jgi:hypothetical protein
MAFTGTYSGNTLLYITQTGTDTDLTGLASFTYYDSASVSTALGFTLGWAGLAIYFIDVPIIINGTLSYDSSEELLALSTSFPDAGSGFDFALRVTGSGASMSVGVQQSTNPNGTPRYSEGVGLVVGFDFTAPSPLNYIWNEGMLVDDSATLTVNGSELQLASPLKIAANSGIVTFNGTRIVDINNRPLSKQTIRNEAPASILRLNNVEFDAKFQPQRFINLSGLDTFSGVFKNSYLQPHRVESDPNIPAVGGKVTLSNVIFGNNANSYDWQLVGNSTTATDNQAIELTNVDIGTGIRPNQVAPGVVNHLAIFQNIKITVKDTSFNAIQDCKVRIPTTDSTNRNNTNIGGQFIGNLDFTGTTYEEYSDPTNVNGETPQYKVLTGRIWNDNLTSTTYTYDLYGKTQVAGEDKFDVQFVSYLHNLASQEVTLKTANDIELERVLTLDASITETNKATVDAYSSLDITAKLYDRAKAELFDAYSGESQTTVTRVGSLIDCRALNVDIDATASTAFSLVGNTLTIKASDYTDDMTTTGLITLSNGAVFSGTRTDANGTISPPQPISITNISAGSRLQLYNGTTSTETVNQVVSGTSYTSSYTEGVEYTDGDTVQWKLTKLGKDELTGNVLATSSGFSVLAEQVDSTVYAAMGVDGSTVTKFAADYSQSDVNLVIATDWTMAELYAWWMYNLTTEQGIREFFGGITAIDQSNFRINTSVVNLYLDNNTNASFKQTDNRRLFRDTGDGYPIKDPPTSGYGLDAVWRNTILIAETETSGLTSAESAKLDDIANVKAKTDLLTFTGTDVKATLDGEEVATDAASREASKASLTGIESDLETINQGVQKSSILVPHTDNL